MLDESNVGSKGRLLDNSYIMDTTAKPPVYRALLALKPEDLKVGTWAQQAGLARNYFNGLAQHGNPKSEQIDRLLSAISTSRARYEEALAAATNSDHTVLSEVRGLGLTGAREVRKEFFGEDPLAPLKLLGSAMGGEYGEIDEHIELTELHLSEVLDYLPRPASLARDPDAYALAINGDSMVPRFKPSERVTVSPRAAISIGDDVIVQLRSTDSDDERIKMVLIKELVRRSASHVELLQHNPPVTFRVPIGRVAAMHRVMGRYV